MHRRTVILAAILFSVSLASAGCGEEEFESRWRDREIVIDGKASEWRGTEQYSDDDKGVRFAVINDGEYLYMCLTTWNRKTQQQILVRGLTVWFDEKGGDERVYGIDFPMTKGPGEMQEFRDAATADRVRAIEDLLVRSRSEMIIGRSKDHAGEWMFVEDGKELGIEAVLDIDDRILVYELKVPLTGGEGLPFPDGMAEGGLASLGLEMGKVDVDEMRRQMQEQRPPGGGMPGGGMGGMGGMGGSARPGGGPDGMREAMEEELEVWMKIRLATAQ
jgi:hypothetical protein